MLILSPIEQFQVFPVLFISNLSFYLVLIFILLLLIEKQPFIFQKHIQWWFPNFKSIESHLFILLTIWFMILFSNLIGMMPYSSTITAQIVMVICLSLPLFIAINIKGISLHGWNIFYLILPAGAPIALIPAIAALELLSYLIRVLSLTLRLGANMVAGHILMKIMLYALMSTPLAAVLIVPIVGLELMVAGIQAYVFLTLSLSYYQDVFLPH